MKYFTETENSLGAWNFSDGAASAIAVNSAHSRVSPVPLLTAEIAGGIKGRVKAGNARVRTLMVEIAWLWLRYQPDSKLSRWFRERFANGGTRMRRVGIVALSRRLLIALWHYLESGLIPEGAQLRSLNY